MAATQTKFQQWVEKHGGPSELSRTLGIPRHTIYFWSTRRSTPSAENLKVLKDFAGSELSYEDIIEGTAKQ